MKQKARKIISVITASLLLLTTGFITARTTVADAGEVVLQQYGNEWSSYPYGDGNIGNSGCGAMAIVNSVRYLTGNTMDIYALADWASENEYIWGVGSSFTIAPNAAAKFGSQYGFQLDTHYGYSSYVGNCYPGSEEAYDAAWNMLVTKLSKGETAVGLVHNHFISIVDYDSATDRVLVYDPGAGSKRETTKSGDWKTYDELNYWSEEGTTYLKLRGYLTFYFATGTSSGSSSSSSSSTTTAAPEFDGTSDAAGTYTVVTNGTGLNMRSQPTTASTILLKIPEGTEVQVIKSNGSWASVTYDGISGYCSMDYLVPAEETETTTTASTTAVTTTTTTTSAVTSTEALSEEYAGEYIVSAGGSYLNMREGRGTSYSIVAQIPDGSSVTVTAADEDWAAVTWDGNSGYCSMDFLVKASETTAETAAATTTTTTTTAATTTEAETETEASSSSTTILTTTTTEAVTSETAATTNNLAGAYSVKTDGAHLNLRAAGSLNAEILAQIPNGSELFVISSDGDWSNVSWNGIVGYCKAEYLSRIIIDAEQSAGSIANVNPAYAVLYGDTNLDGEVTMADIVLLHKALSGAITLNRTASANSDCYSDLELNTVDATVMIQHVSDNCAVPIEPIV